MEWRQLMASPKETRIAMHDDGFYHSQLLDLADPPPHLLVSVRDEEEAEAARQGGCDILDIKEPARGSLGMAAPQTIARIVALVRQRDRRMLLSAALGEVIEWTPDRQIPVIPQSVGFLKLGPAGLPTLSQWRRRWPSTRQCFEERAGRTLGWVAVAYADREAAKAPAVEAIVDQALEEGLPVVLIDTYTKAKGRLLDWLQQDQLARLAERIHAGGARLAAAGRLTRTMVDEVLACGVDILAIRSAACVGGLRTGRVCSAAVRQFRSTIRVARSTSGSRPKIENAN